jgi:hypothetical protein
MSGARRRAHREGMTGIARMRAIARDGDSATTPLVLLLLVSGALALFIAVTLTLMMLLYELE